jgi:hypothetical protein
MYRNSIALGIAAFLALGGCSLKPNGAIDWSGSLDAATNRINRANIAASKYLPIVGKDLLAIGNIIVQAECSPILNPATNATEIAISLVAPNSSAASTAQAALTTNQAVAAALCPLYKSIVASVGPVPASAPSGAPVQIIPTN